MYTLDDVKAWALREIEIEGEDFIYRKDEREVRSDGTLGTVDCFYYIDGEPSCLVGRMLDAQGIIGPDVDGNAPVGALDEVRRIPFTMGARTFLQFLQSYQDRGKTWGESYREAVKHSVR